MKPFYLFCWGGFYNPVHVKQHGISKRHFWFDTYLQRENYEKWLISQSKRYNAHMLCTDKYDAFVKDKVIVHTHWTFEGTPQLFKYEFSNYGWKEIDLEGQLYYFTEGNMSCTCNLSIRTEGLEELDCDAGKYSIEQVDFVFPHSKFTRIFKWDDDYMEYKEQR